MSSFSPGNVRDRGSWKRACYDPGKARADPSQSPGQCFLRSLSSLAESLLRDAVRGTQTTLPPLPKTPPPAPQPRGSCEEAAIGSRNFTHHSSQSPAQARHYHDGRPRRTNSKTTLPLFILMTEDLLWLVGIRIPLTKPRWLSRVGRMKGVPQLGRTTRQSSPILFTPPLTISVLR